MVYLDQVEGVSGSKRESERASVSGSSRGRLWIQERERESGVKDDFEARSRSGLTERERERERQRESER